MNHKEKNYEPDPRQWIPIYGIYRIGMDYLNGRPTLLDSDGVSRPGVMVYHVWSSIAFGRLAYFSGALAYETAKKLL